MVLIRERRSEVRDRERKTRVKSQQEARRFICTRAAMLLLLIACSLVLAQEPKLTGTWVFTDGKTRLTLKLNDD